MLGVVLLLFGMLGIQDSLAIIAFSLLYGFCQGAYLAMLAPAVMSLTEDKEEIGQHLGFMYFITAFGSLLSTPVQGALLGQAFRWHRAIIFSGVMLFSGTCLIAFAHYTVSKRRGTQLV